MGNRGGGLREWGWRKGHTCSVGGKQGWKNRGEGAGIEIARTEEQADSCRDGRKGIREQGWGH